MSDRHPLTERIISRSKAIAVHTEGDSVEELTVEHFLQAFRSLEDEDEIRETLEVFFEDANTFTCLVKYILVASTFLLSVFS